MPEREYSDQQFAEALKVVREGDFDKVKSVLRDLGFQFKAGKDPNHCIYFHPALIGDPIFRYAQNLYRQHGKRRSSDRITQLDAARARRIIRTLQAYVKSSREGAEDE